VTIIFTVEHDIVEWLTWWFCS